MKKKIYLGGVTLATMMFFASCSSCTNNDGDKKVIKTDSLPRNPTQGQVYHDNNGHSWVYDAILMRWALGGGSMGGSNNYYYYPSTGSYQDNAGRAVTPPASVSSGISDGVKARTQTVTKTVTTTPSRSTSTSIKSTNTSKPSSSSKAVFGSTGRSHSISA